VLADRIGREVTYSLGAGLVAAAIVVLWLVSSAPAGRLPYLYAVLIGGGYAAGAVIPPIVAADLYRGAGYAAIFDGISLASNWGTGVGARLAGFVPGRHGDLRLPRAFRAALAR
jgi:MFS family permease